MTMIWQEVISRLFKYWRIKSSNKYASVFSFQKIGTKKIKKKLWYVSLRHSGILLNIPSQAFQILLPALDYWLSAAVTFRNPQYRFHGEPRTAATITSHPQAHLCLPRVLSIHTPPVVSSTNTSPEQSSWLLQPRRRLSAAASFGKTSDRHFPCEMPGVRFSHNFIVVSDVNSFNCSDVLELHWPILVLQLRLEKSVKRKVGRCSSCKLGVKAERRLLHLYVTASELLGVRSSKSV